MFEKDIYIYIYIYIYVMGVVENQLNKEEEENYIPILSPLLKNTCFPLKKNLSLIAKS